MTDAEVGYLWQRARYGWSKYADEQEWQILQLIRKLVEERAEAINAEWFDQTERSEPMVDCRREAVWQFGISWEEFNDNG